MEYIPIILVAVTFIAICCVAFRIAFPKQSSWGLRVFSTVLVSLLWSSAIHEAFLSVYQFAQSLLSVEGIRSSVKLRTDLLRAIDQIPYFRLFIAYLTLALLVRTMASATNGSLTPLINVFKGWDRTIRLNSLVLGVFFAGIYLCVASLCTIPALQVNQPFTEDERNETIAQIDAYALSDDAFEKQFPPALAFRDAQLENLRKQYRDATGQTLYPACISQSGQPDENKTADAMPKSLESQAKTAANQQSSPPPGLPLAVNAIKQNPRLASQIQEVLDEHDQYFCSRLTQYQAMRSTVRQILRGQTENAKNQINSNFAIRLTGRDRADYLFSLKSNISDLANTTQAALSRCKTRSETDGGEFSEEAASLEQRIQAPVPESDAQSQENNFHTYFPQMFENGSCSLEGISWRSQTIAPSPQMGIFTFFFGWLENSDSLALAVLCGMLGVGLTGSIVTTFVRQGNPAEGQPWISDAFPVIARGFTAAIVVYLTIEGGLNIFSTTANQPNPYVLLFACLVGAVFSEDAWIAARKRLQSAEEVRGPENKGFKPEHPNETTATNPPQSDTSGEKQKP